MPNPFPPSIYLGKGCPGFRLGVLLQSRRPGWTEPSSITLCEMRHRDPVFPLPHIGSTLTDCPPFWPFHQVRFLRFPFYVHMFRRTLSLFQMPLTGLNEIDMITIHFPGLLNTIDDVLIRRPPHLTLKATPCKLISSLSALLRTGIYLQFECNFLFNGAQCLVNWSE